jgi:metal-sulfur cluster biosynthetic enzyme
MKRKLLGPSEQDVMNALKECKDPELPVNIVDLGLIYGVNVKGGKITVEMTLTVRGCPLVNLISENVKMKLLPLDGVDEVEVKIVWDPPWTPDRMSEDTKRMLGWGVEWGR